jgi:hypothetical protein
MQTKYDEDYNNNGIYHTSELIFTSKFYIHDYQQLSLHNDVNTFCNDNNVANCDDVMNTIVYKYNNQYPILYQAAMDPDDCYSINYINYGYYEYINHSNSSSRSSSSTGKEIQRLSVNKSSVNLQVEVKSTSNLPTTSSSNLLNIVTVIWNNRSFTIDHYENDSNDANINKSSITNDDFLQINMQYIIFTDNYDNIEVIKKIRYDKPSLLLISDVTNTIAYKSYGGSSSSSRGNMPYNNIDKIISLERIHWMFLASKVNSNTTYLVWMDRRMVLKSFRDVNSNCYESSSDIRDDDNSYKNDDINDDDDDDDDVVAIDDDIDVNIDVDSFARVIGKSTKVSNPPNPQPQQQQQHHHQHHRSIRTDEWSSDIIQSLPTDRVSYIRSDSITTSDTDGSSSSSSSSSSSTYISLLIIHRDLLPIIHDIFYDEFSKCRQRENDRGDDSDHNDNDSHNISDDDGVSHECLSEDYILMKMIETRPHLFHILTYEQSGGICVLWGDDRI